MPQKIKNEFESRIIELYKQGNSTQKIENLEKISRRTVSKILERNSIEKRTLSQCHELRYGTKINHECFEELNENCLYWIGFLYADGSLNTKVKNLIEVCLQKQDYSHLEKLIDFLQTNKKVEYNMQSDNMCRLRFCSEKIVKKLRELGFDCDKSHSATPNNLVKNSKDFWRGVIDGDGSLSFDKDKYPIVSLTGSKNTITEFLNFIKNKEIKTKANCNLVRKYHKSHQIAIKGSEAKKLATLLYKDSKTYLNRKYEKHLQF